MLHLAVQTDQGPIGIVGICDANVTRMRAGSPLTIDMKKITPPGTRVNQVVVHLAHSYEQVVDDMADGGLPVNDELRRRAKKLDEQVRRERLEKARRDAR